MATLNAQNSAVTFFMSVPGHVVPDVAIGGSATQFDWRTIGVSPSTGDPLVPDRLTASGTGFTYDGGLSPTAGNVTSIAFDLRGNGVNDVLITMDGASVTGGLPNLFPTAGSDEQKATLFWASILYGNDTLIAPSNGLGDMTGDFFQVRSNAFTQSNLTGGNDSLTVNTLGQLPAVLSARGDGLRALCGDAFLVQGQEFGQFLYEASLTGGRDTIHLSGLPGLAGVGDALTVSEFGVLHGGADTIVSDVTERPGAPSFQLGTPLLAGDAYEVWAFGTVIGGGDKITGSNYAFLADTISGDVFAASWFVTGGRDSISGRAGQDRIAGDVYRLNFGTLNAGADVIRGGEDSDVIAGDVYEVNVVNGIAPEIVFVGGNDLIFGDNGNDLIAGDILSGGAATASQIRNGNDTINGGDGDDQIYGDSLLAISALALPAGGDDILNGGLGDDFLDGQDGSDTAVYNTILAAVTVSLTTGIASGQGTDNLSNIENVVGSALNDTISGNTLANKFTGGAGKDVIDGGADSDLAIYSEKTASVSVALNGAAFVNVLVGGVAEDRIRNIESITGGSGNDTLIGDTLANDLTGGAGNDFLQGKGGPDDLDGGLGVDTASFADSTFLITVTLNGSSWALVDNSGGGNEDHVRNIENIIGGSGGDTIKGDALVNALSGGAGNDFVRGGLGNDRLDGGTGFDTADYGDKGLSVIATLNGVNPISVRVNGVIEDTISNFENLNGGTKADTFTGDANANRLDGGAGNDILDGQANNDVLTGGLGLDTLTGGLGADRFQFLLPSAGVDVITDFTHLTDDIVISAASFGGGLVAGALAAARFVANAAPVATQAFGQFLYETDTGKLTWDQNGTAAGGQFLIAQLQPFATPPVLSTADFVIF